MPSLTNRTVWTNEPGEGIFFPSSTCPIFVLLPVVSRRRRPRTKLQLCAISSPQLSRALENRNLIFRWHETTLIPRVPSYCIVSSGWLTKLCHLNSISRLILRERFLAKKKQMRAITVLWGFGSLLVCIHSFDWLDSVGMWNYTEWVHFVLHVIVFLIHKI